MFTAAARVAAVAQVRSLVWEPPTGCGPKEKAGFLVCFLFFFSFLSFLFFFFFKSKFPMEPLYLRGVPQAPAPALPTETPPLL